MTSQAIADLVPHRGGMVLLDEIMAWSPTAITCRTGSHRRVDNPLRRAGALPAVAGIEYGAQAMAVHGALLAGGTAQAGHLASVRAVRWHADRLDLVAEDLLVTATLAAREAGGMIYGFAVATPSAELVSGQIAIRLFAGPSDRAGADA
jgi:predicted hotdog family 3-hydroxylacyl-ACP dehydratase